MPHTIRGTSFHRRPSSWHYGAATPSTISHDHGPPQSVTSGRAPEIAGPQAVACMVVYFPRGATIGGVALRCPDGRVVQSDNQTMPNTLVK